MSAMPFSFPIFKAFTTTGTLGPLAGGLLHTFEAGTSTPLAVYQDDALTVPHTNPVVLDSNGQATIYIGQNAYKMRLEDSAGVVQPGWPIDNIEDEAGNLRSDLASPATGKGDALVIVKQPYAGSSARTQHDKNAEFVSVTDFYANGISGVSVDPSGATDSTMGIQAALNNRGCIYFPAGTYRITSHLIIKAYTKIFGDDGKTVIKLDNPTIATSMLEDSSVGTPADLNPYITIEGIEFDGNNSASVAQVTGTISGTLLTVSSVASGAIKVGQTIYNPATLSVVGVISSFGTGSGGAGTYNITNPGSVSLSGVALTISWASACINMFRVKNVNINRCYFHDTGGTPVNILGSQTDSYDINVTECTSANSLFGDAFAFSGTHINIYKCVALNFKDTGFAIIQDLANRSGTNPANDYPRNITFTDCRADGTTNDLAAGFAFGPFVNWNTLGNVNVRIIGCTTENCNVGLWSVAANGIIIENCNFAPHKATDTGNVRLDGCSNVTVKSNTISMAATAPSGLYSALLIQAARFTFGASDFDADVYNVRVEGNRFNNSANDAIICTFETIGAAPAFTSKLYDVWFDGNYFEASRYCINFLPQNGSTATVCNRISINYNRSKNVTNLINFNGVANQFTNFECIGNKFDGSGAFKTGTGSANIFTDSATAWSPAFTGLTVVGAPIITGNAYQLGKRLFVDVVIDPNGGTTASAGYGTTYINNLPRTSAGPGVGGVNDLNTASYLGGTSTSGSSVRCDVPSWTARGDFINISLSYPIP